MFSLYSLKEKIGVIEKRQIDKFLDLNKMIKNQI